MASQDKGHFGRNRNRPSEAGQKSGPSSHGGQASQSSGGSAQQMGGSGSAADLSQPPQSGRTDSGHSGGGRH